MLLLAHRLFAKGFDQRPPRQVRLDDVPVALGEACGGAGFHIGISNREPSISASVLHHLEHFTASIAQVLEGLRAPRSSSPGATLLALCSSCSS